MDTGLLDEATIPPRIPAKQREGSQTADEPQPGPGKYLLTAIYSLFVLGLALASSIYSMQRPLSTVINSSEYGLRTLKSESCSATQGARLGAVIFAVNLAASLVISASDNAKIGLLAPSPTMFENGMRDLGFQSFKNFRSAGIVRQMIWVILFLTSLPIHYLSNSIFFVTKSSYKSYEVVASTLFLENHDFDVRNLSMNYFNDLPPNVGLSHNITWPSDYGGVTELIASLQSVQKTPGQWRNLSHSDCATAYNQAVYSKYRTLLVITNYTTPDFNNSALAIGVLPGYRSTSIGASLLALCPDAYLETYKGASRPEDSVYILQPAYGNALPIEYVDPAVAIQNALNKTTRSLSSRQIWSNPTQIQYYNALPEVDLCYSYWPANLTTSASSGGLLYSQPRVPFLYCFAEEITAPLACRFVYSPLVLYTIAIVLLIKATCIMFATFLRWRYMAFYRWNDATEYYHDKGRPLGVSELDVDHSYRNLGVLVGQLIAYVLLFCWIWVLWSASEGNLLKHGFQPVSLTDTTWFLQVILFYKSLHIILNILAFFQENWIALRVSISESDDDAPPPSLPFSRSCLSLCSHYTKAFLLDFPTWLMVILPLRTTLIHLVVGWVFIIRFVDIVPLGEVVGDTNGVIPSVFWTLGIESFNTGDGLNSNVEWEWIYYGAFAIFVLVLVPMILLELAWAFACALRVWVGLSNEYEYVILWRKYPR